jgi:hypothetical protein
VDYCYLENISFYLREIWHALVTPDLELFRRWLETILLLVIAVLAFIQEPIKRKFSKTKLSVKLSDMHDFAQYANRDLVRFFHISIKNLKPKRPATNAKVLLNAVYKKSSKGVFERLPQAFPYQFKWAPEENHHNDPFPTIHKSRTADFGHLTQNKHTFVIALAFLPYGFGGNIHFDEPAKEPDVYRYGITVEADNFVSKEPYYIEVSWNGHWGNTLSELGEHLKVREVQKRDWLPG